MMMLDFASARVRAGFDFISSGFGVGLLARGQSTAMQYFESFKFKILSEFIGYFVIGFFRYFYLGEAIMVRLNRRLGRNVFGSILLFAIISCTLISGTAFCEEVAAPLLTQSEKDFAQAETLRKSRKFAEAKVLFLSVSQDSSDT